MNDQNRYEDVPQKENKFKKALKAFGAYWKFVFVDFFNSFKYNNMKLASILFALPGLLLGFFMFAHVPTIRNITVGYSISDPESDVNIVATDNDSSAATNDYYITLDKYTINDNTYTNIKMEINTDIDEETINTTPIDSPAVDGKTALSTPVVSLTQNSSVNDETGATEYEADKYTISITGLTDEELEDVQAYYLFLYMLDGSTYYYLGNSYYLEPTANTFSVNILNTGSYYAAIKAISKGNTYSGSALSDPANCQFNSSKAGSSYDAKNFQFVKYIGDYKVVSASEDLDDNLKNFSVQITGSGETTYSTSSSSVTAQLYGTTADALYTNNVLNISILPFDFSGICIFFLTLFGFLNVFLSLDLSKKKNFGTVMKCTATTAAIAILGALYIYAIIATNNSLGEGKLTILNQDTKEPITTLFNTNCIISVVTIIASVVFSLAGLVLAFINYDRTYEKVDR